MLLAQSIISYEAQKTSIIIIMSGWEFILAFVGQRSDSFEKI